MLIHGAGMAYVGAGWVLTTCFRAWLLSAPYLFLVAVCAVSPFWFIVPNLSP